MKKIDLLLGMLMGLMVFLPLVLSQSPQDTDVSVNVEESCQASLYNFEQPGLGEDHKILGTGDSDYFSGLLANTGTSKVDLDFNLTVTKHENISLSPTVNQSYVIPPDNEQPGNYTFNESLPVNTQTVNDTSFKQFLIEFEALDSYDVGNYTGRAEVKYKCGNETGEVLQNRTFEIVKVEGDGNSPDEPGEDSEVDQELDLDALIEALNQTSDLDTNTTEMENASLNLDALIEQLNRTGQIDTDVNRTENSSLDSDAEESADDAEPREGDGDFPGQTPEPEPQPEPQPLPLLSLDIRPLNSTYEAPRNKFTEVGLELENVGEESLTGVTLAPRFSEEMDWEMQQSNLESLAVGDSTNKTVYVNPGESVEPGIYQISVYASNTEADIDMQYVNVEVTQQVFDEILDIDEAPRDIRFEKGQNYTVPITFRNSGQDPVNNVSVELQNAEACGEYTMEGVDSINPGSTASANIRFEASQEIGECSATVVASSEAGSLAFSEMNIETVEEVGVVPEEFRVPIVASMWTIMLLAYAVLTKKYGMHNLAVKIPLVLLVVGEAFILIYLSSVYYNLLPPGLLPF